MTNEEIVYLITLTIIDKVKFNNLENITDNLITFIRDSLLSEIDVPSIEYSINNNIIYILITTRQEIKIKNNLVEKYLYDKIDNIEELTKIKKLLKCITNKLKNIRTLEEYFIQQNRRRFMTYLLIGE